MPNPQESEAKSLEAFNKASRGFYFKTYSYYY